MTSFVHVNHATEHPGLARAERAAEAMKHVAKGLEGGRAGASLLLAAIVAALVVIANQVIDAWTDGHLLAAWVVMWAVAFAGLALLATPARRVAYRLRSVLRGYAAQRRQARQDDEMWELALTDARVMADISRAMTAGAVRDIRGFY